SSDVCSSDLGGLAGALLGQGRRVLLRAAQKGFPRLGLVAESEVHERHAMVCLGNVGALLRVLAEEVERLVQFAVLLHHQAEVAVAEAEAVVVRDGALQVTDSRLAIAELDLAPSEV